MSVTVSAIVLAAGSSTRMGTPKPLVCVAGEPMLQRVLSALRQSQVDETVVVLGHSAELIRERIAFGEARIVVNTAHASGMAGSIQMGVANLRTGTEAALIVLADQPFLTPATIDLLIGEYRSKKSQIVIPTHNGARGNPVLIDRSLFPEVAALTGDVGCRAIFGKHSSKILHVAVHDAGVLLDLDTEADVQRQENATMQD